MKHDPACHLSLQYTLLFLQGPDGADVAFDHAEEAMEGGSDLDPSDDDGFDEDEGDDGFGDEFDDEDEEGDDMDEEVGGCCCSGFSLV